jgi:nucleoside-diphosphate-sugar epimerase
VGQATAARLVDAGHEVVGLARSVPNDDPRLSNAIAADIGETGVGGQLAREHQRCDAIVHAAASLERDLYAPAVPLTNCLGTQQMLGLAARWNVRSFVFLSSVPVISRPGPLPVTEEHPVDPPTAYHASKLFGERLAAIARAQGIPTVVLRLTSPVGPGMPRERILPVFISRALVGAPLEVAGKGSRCQDYVDVRDVAGAVAAGLERRSTGVLNIASGRCISNLDLARRCAAVLRSSSEIQVGRAVDPEEGIRWEVSIAKAERELGYRPRRSLDDSIAAVADELRACGDG